jgi:predicted NACHT family NTPase
LLVGRPGSGKSTALARLVLDEARQRRSIPVMVELRSWQGSVLGSSIVELIGNALRRHRLALTEGQLEALWQDDRLLLLFDGLNELPSEAARSQLTAFRQNHLNIPMIFTTRDLSIGGDFGIEKRLEMQPLTELQMQTFVRSYIPDLAEKMLRQLSDRLRELGQTPLLLWMLCDLFRTMGEIPENLGLVFRLFTQGYERKLKQDVPIESDREWWKPVLQQLAWVMMQGEKPTELRVKIGKSEAVRAIGQFLEGKVPYAEDFARKCLRDLQQYHCRHE